MTSTESSKVKEKMKNLNLVEGEDFTLADVRERGRSGAQTHKHYHLTPEAFKKCLMRAQRRANQPVCIFFSLKLTKDLINYILRPF